MIPRSLDPAHGTWKDDLRAALRDGEALGRAQRLPPAPDGARAAARQFPVLVPPAFLAAAERGDPDDPLLRQVLPRAEEMLEVPGFGTDAVGDLPAMVAPGVIHKYHGRVLLVATGACAVHCRYCFRRHFPYDLATASADRWRRAAAYIRSRPEVREVILSGGDPLTLGTARLEELSAALADAASLARLRIHSRIPTVLPSRIDAALLRWLESLPWRRVLVIHVNHARELTTPARRALAELAAAGCRLLNQAVLLAGVNDDPGALADLSEALDECGVLPYYLHFLDPVAGAAHFAVPAASAVRLLDGLRERLPGYLVPRLVQDRAGAPSKRPLDGAAGEAPP